MRTTRLRVTLRDVVPTVQRVVDVPADVRLDELHEILQVALGWTDSHLHQFLAGDRRYGFADDETDLDEQDETTATLAELPDTFVYLYDFGDGWEHEVERLGPGAGRPGCVEGTGACPPEDCGGAPGYADTLEALADPRHPEHGAVNEWVGPRLAAFDRVRADELVDQVVGAAPASVQFVLELAVGGVKLTPGGRLPRTFVRAVQEQRPAWSPLGQPASMEEDLPALAVLHDLLRHVGLLRLSKGMLTPTKAASNERDVVRRLRSWSPRRGFATMIATDAIAALHAHGDRPLPQLSADVFSMLGYGWGLNGRPLAVKDVTVALGRLSNVLIALDQIVIDGTAWSVGTSSRTLLPRATHLIAILERELPSNSDGSAVG